MLAAVSRGFLYSQFACDYRLPLACPGEVCFTVSMTTTQRSNLIARILEAVERGLITEAEAVQLMAEAVAAS
jgi:hypothetical protein